MSHESIPKTIDTSKNEVSPSIPFKDIENPNTDTNKINKSLNIKQEVTLFKGEKEKALNEINAVRTSLGLPETEELPVHLARKEEGLNSKLTQEEKEKGYIDFEEVPDQKSEIPRSIDDKNTEEKVRKLEKLTEQKLKSFYAELEKIPIREYIYLRNHGFYVSGEPFITESFKALSPEMIKKMLTFYETHQDISLAVVREFESEQTEIINLITEEIKEDNKDEDTPQQPLLENESEKKMLTYEKFDEDNDKVVNINQGNTIENQSTQKQIEYKEAA